MSYDATKGEIRVRIDFNVSSNSNVDLIKHKTAELINLIDSLPNKNGEMERLKSLAMTSYEEAAMWAVKAATA
jgi:hypothetical protein